MIDLPRLTLENLPLLPAPLYARLQQAIEDQIADGTLKPGEKLPSERELQKELGFSRTTIRQALQGLIEGGLVQVVPRTGNFVLDRLASSPLTVPSLPFGGNKTVGMIISYPSFHICYSQLAAVFKQRLHQAGWQLKMALYNDNRDLFQGALNTMLMNGVRVFAINPPPFLDLAPILDDLLDHGALVQLIGRWIDYPRCDFIGTDNELIGYQATQYLIQLGHTRIIYRGEVTHPTGHDRGVGYVRAMHENRLPPRIFGSGYPQRRLYSPSLLAYVELHDSTEELIHEVVQRKVTAAFCFNDDDAISLSDELRKHNLEVPRDLSVVSVDNIPYYRITVPPLTTFALPGEEMGRQAAELLLRRITSEVFPPQKMLIPALFIQRQSAVPLRLI